MLMSIVYVGEIFLFFILMIKKLQQKSFRHNGLQNLCNNKMYTLEKIEGYRGTLTIQYLVPYSNCYIQIKRTPAMTQNKFLLISHNDVYLLTKIHIKHLQDTSCRSDIYSNQSQQMISIPNHIYTCETQNYNHFFTCKGKDIVRNINIGYRRKNYIFL